MSNARYLLDAIKGMADLDTDNLPSMQFMGKLRAALIAEGFSVVLAERIVGAMEIELQPGSITDEELDELSVGFAVLVARMSKSLTKVGFENLDDVITRMASQFNVKLG